MKVVEPIRDKEVVRDVAEFLAKKNARDHLLFVMGVYTGLRISDLLNIRIRDVRNQNHLIVIESKTQKSKTVKLSSVVQQTINEFIEDREPYEYLFKSRVGKNRAISRERAYGILREVADHLGLQNIGCHSMRKTFGYHVYQNTKDVALLQDIFNHSSPDITLRYIGVNQDTKDKAVDSLDFF